MSELDFMLTVDSCFGALNLKIGSLVIAMIELLIPFLLIAYYNFDCVCDDTYDEDESIFSIRWVCYMTLLLHVLFIASAVLVIITYSDTSLKILLYIAIWIQMCLLIIYLCVVLFLYCTSLVDENCVGALFLLIVRLVLLAILTYFVIVLNSWYKKLNI